MTKTKKHQQLLILMATILVALTIVLGGMTSHKTGKPQNLRTQQQSVTVANGDYATGKTPATPGAQPWMVALADATNPNGYDAQFCGASLIAPQWVLTAAHCLESTTDANEVDVIIGRYQLSTNAGERIRATDIFMHSGYADYFDGENNDIALIKLSKPATKGTPIDAITAANEYVDDAGSTARVTGWGQMSENGDATDKLHGVNIPVVAQNVCKATDQDGSLSSDDLCAGEKAGGKDSCYGDSGGPLTATDRNGKPVQIGIVSYGLGECGEPGTYGVYIRLTEYEQWLKDVKAGKIAATDMEAYADNFEYEYEEDEDGSYDDEWEDDDNYWDDDESDWDDDESDWWEEDESDDWDDDNNWWS